MIDPLPEQEKEPAVIISRSFRVENGNYGPATFVVRVLFRRILPGRERLAGRKNAAR